MDFYNGFRMQISQSDFRPETIHFFFFIQSCLPLTISNQILTCFNVSVCMCIFKRRFFSITISSVGPIQLLLGAGKVLALMKIFSPILAFKNSVAQFTLSTVVMMARCLSCCHGDKMAPKAQTSPVLQLQSRSLLMLELN